MTGLSLLFLLLPICSGLFNLQVAPQLYPNQVHPVVTESVVANAFSISDDATTYVWDYKISDLTFTWSWTSNGTSSQQSANYELVVGVGDTDALSSFELSIPIIGMAPLNKSFFNLSFNCSTYGTSFVTFVFSFTHPDLSFPDTYFIKFQKNCAPPQCDGLCNSPYGACVNSLCECQPGWTASYFCDFGFYLDKTEVCPDEEFTIYWNRTINDTLNTDWISISFPFPPDIASGDMTYLISSIGWTQAFWCYLNGETKYGSDVIPVGSFTESFAEVYPGNWTVVYFTNDRYIPLASVSLTMLSPSDPACLKNATILTCVDGQGTYNSSTQLCDCETGFFGAHCEHGCFPFTSFGDHFGEDFSSSVDGSPFYGINVSCSWYFPQIATTVEGMDRTWTPTSMTLLILELGTEVITDTVTILGDVSDMNGTNYTSSFGPYSGSSSDSTLIVPLPALFQFETDAYNPSWAEMKRFGFLATYRLNGCPPGAHSYYNQTSKIWHCARCPPNQFTLVVDFVGDCLACDAISQPQVDLLRGVDRLGYNLACISQVQVWRLVIAVVAITWTAIVNGICLVLLFLRRNYNPLTFRSLPLLYAYTLGSLAMLQVPLMDYIPEMISCGHYFWWTSLKTHLFVIPVLIITYRLRLLMELQVTKKQVQRALDSDRPQQEPVEEKASKGLIRRLLKEKRRHVQAVSLKLVAQVTKIKVWSKPSRQLLVFLAVLIFPVLVAVLNWTSEKGTFDYSHNLQADGCFGTTRIFFTEMVFFFVYSVFITYQLFRIRDGIEGFGMKREISRFAITYFILSLLQYVIILSVDPSFERTFNLRYLIWLVATIFQYDAVLVPCLQTMPAFMALFQPNLDEQAMKVASQNNLEELLKTKRGMQFFMEHCRREFSEENLMCYQDIEEFHKRFNNDNFLRIFNKYFSSQAPFPVNLPEKIIKELRAKESALARVDLQSLQSAFDDARVELLNLMESDTYTRFLKSALFVSFCKGEQLRMENNASRDGSRGSSHDYDDGSEVYSGEDEPLSPPTNIRTSIPYEPLHKGSNSTDRGKGGCNDTEASRSHPDVEVDSSRITPTSSSHHPSIPNQSIQGDKTRDSDESTIPASPVLPRIAERSIEIEKPELPSPRQSEIDGGFNDVY